MTEVYILHKHCYKNTKVIKIGSGNKLMKFKLSELLLLVNIQVRSIIHVTLLVGISTIQIWGILIAPQNL